MTTDWTALRLRFTASPYYYTDNMKDCFVYDNPCGHSVKELMLILNETCDDIMTRFDTGVAKYKFVKRKGGNYSK